MRTCLGVAAALALAAAGAAVLDYVNEDFEGGELVLNKSKTKKAKVKSKKEEPPKDDDVVEGEVVDGEVFD